MKKIFTLFSLVAISLSATAQTPPNKNVGIVNKTTATWCGPCGSWGWTLFDGIISDNQSKAICMGTYGSNSSDMYNQTAGDFYSDFASGAGWPAFCAIGINRTAYSSTGGIFTGQTQSNVKTTIDSFATSPVKASTGYKYSISGSTLTVNTTTKFWQADNGDFYVNVYLVEDGVMNTQNGQTGVVAHHHVLRGGVTGTWGTSIVNGAVAANATFAKNFSFTIPSTWDKSKLEVVTMIWKKVGSDYQFINANNTAEAAVGVTDIAEAGNIRLFPNPTNNMAHLSLDIPENTTLSYTISDIQGRILHQQATKEVLIGKQYEDISVATWMNGYYVVRVNLGNNSYTGKLLIQH